MTLYQLTKTTILSLMTIASGPTLAQSHANERESVLVQRLSDGKIIYQSQPDESLSPASLTKLVSSAALLYYYGPAHTFKTKFYYTGSRTGDKITGDLIVKGDGDPLITNEKLWQLASDLRNMGVKQFTGSLLIDNTLFDQEKRDESRRDGIDASDRAYDAPVSAFGLNFNTLPIVIAPNLKEGDQARVSFDPYPIPNLTLLNRTLTSSGTKSSIQAIRQSQSELSQLTVSGNIGKNAPMIKLYRSMGNPVIEGGEQLRAFLSAEGISIKGEVREDKLPTQAQLLYVLNSYDLGFIVKGLNHYSNNYIADMLIKRLGASFPSQGESDTSGSGTLANGIQAIEKFLKNEVGIKDKFEIYNASGLDHRNRFSARQFVRILSYVQQHMEIYPEYLASLPASGWSGTLQKRFKGAQGEDSKGLIRAKTGTLSQPVAVSSLAGYIGHPKHGPLAFAIINNGKKSVAQPSIAEFRQRQDKALFEILEKY